MTDNQHATRQDGTDQRAAHQRESDEHAAEQYQTMGTTATPGTSGAAAIDEPGRPNGSDRGAGDDRPLGGELNDPELPFDRRPGPDDPGHRVPIDRTP
jgi:hypothetical protein